MRRKGIDQTTWIIIGIALGLLVLGILALIASGKFSSFSSFVDTILGRSSDTADCAEALWQCGKECLSGEGTCKDIKIGEKLCSEFIGQCKI